MCDTVVNESYGHKRLWGNNFDIIIELQISQCACGRVYTKQIGSRREYKPGYKEIDGPATSPARFGT